jgi:hypothetical protein
VVNASKPNNTLAGNQASTILPRLNKLERYVYLKQQGNDPSTNYNLPPQIPPKQRTLLLKNLTVGTNIADNVTVYATGTAQSLTGVLRDVIAADLEININMVTGGVSNLLINATIPAATPVDTVLTFTAFAGGSFPILPLNAVLTADIVTSDGSIDINGVASFTLLWM